MLKKVIIALVLVLLSAGVAHAVNVNLKWTASPNCNNYLVFMSVDGGQSWDGGRATGTLTPDAQGEVTFGYDNAPDTGLVLFLVRAQGPTGLLSIVVPRGAFIYQDMPAMSDPVPPSPPGSGSGVEGTY